MVTGNRYYSNLAIALVLVGCSLTIIALPADVSASWRRHNDAVVVNTLPAGHRVVRVGSSTYYVHNGRYYRSRGKSFVVVRAPLGGVVTVLPRGYSAVVVGRSTYYYCAGVYYRAVPQGYVIIDAPQSVADLSIVSQVVVNVAALNVRSGPGRDHGIVDTVSSGQHLNVVATALGWHYVELTNGRSGWVMAKFVRTIKASAQG